MKFNCYILKELVNIKYGKNQKKVVSDDGGIPIYGTGGLMGYATEALYEKPSVLIGRKGTISKVKYVDHPFWTVDTLFYTEVNEDLVIPRFLYYVMSQLDLNAYNEGTTIPSLRTETLNRLEFDIPSIQDQKGVLEYLSIIDEKIQINEAINENLYELANSLFNNYLEQEEANVKYTTIDHISSIKGGKRLPKGINLISEANTHPYIRVRDLNNVTYVVQTSDFEYVDDETQKSISRYIVQTGDVLISIVGTIGLTAIVDVSLDCANLTENCVKLNDLKGISPEYLLLFLRSNEGQAEIIKGTVGAVQAKLPIKNIQSIRIPILPDIEMESLKEKLQPIFAVIASNTAENLKLNNIRDSFLPKLMSGEIDVSDVSI